MQIGNFTFEVFRSNQGLRLRVALPLTRSGLEGAISENDLARLGGFFTPAPSPVNGMDTKLAEEIITRGYRSLARVLHPDAGGSNDAMGILNNTADLIRERLRR